MSEQRGRIMGTEMEWSLLTRESPSSRYVQPEKPSDILQNHKPETLRAIGQYMCNGSRYYVDVGSHMEYATPECDSIEMTLAHEIAGERILHETLTNARNAGMFDGFKLNKRVVDSDANTWGYHTSFSAEKSKMPIDDRHLRPLGLHLATQNIYAGAGAVYNHRQSKRIVFALAQKVLNLNADYSPSSHGSSNPLLSTRNEPLAATEKFSRVHLTSMDANMSPWATRMRLGTTSLLIRAIENGYNGDNLKFKHNTMHVMAKRVAHDLNLENVYELEDGTTISALDIQYELLDEVTQFVEKNGAPKEELDIRDEWEATLEKLQNGPETLRDRADWVLKYEAITTYLGRHGLNIESPAAAAKDLKWDLIDETYGIGMKLRRGSWKKWMPDESTIQAAMTEPPATTRANIRGRLIGKYYESAKDCGAEWNHLKSSKLELNYQFKDPYQTDLEGLQS